MSDLAAPSPSDSDVAATTRIDQSPQPPSSLGSAVVAPIFDDMDDQTLLQPGTHRALFSTDLGKRAKNGVSTPPPPVIVRSNKALSVMETVDFWRRKYPHFAWSIFPESGWTVEDLWDAADIHVETRDHCKEVLYLLCKDNAVTAGLFARDWSLKNTEQFVKFMAMHDKVGMSDPQDPLGLVDMLFVNGEFKNWPRKFLWHTTQALRTSVVQYYQPEENATVMAESTPTSPTANGRILEAEMQPTATAKVDEAILQPGLTMEKAPRSSTVRSTAAPFVPSVASVNETQQPFKRASSHGPTQSGPPYHGQPIGHIMNGTSTHQMVSPSMGGHALSNPKSRPGRQDAYFASSSGTCGENLPRMPSGGYALRPPQGTMPAHSPHFNPAAMAMGPEMMPPHPMHAYPQGFPPMSPSAFAVQPYPPGLGHPMAMPPQHTHAQNMSMPPGYGHQGPNHRRPRGTSIGDVTNIPYYSGYAAPHNSDSRRSDRHSSFYGNSNTPLYDPYNGSRPTFNEHSSGRKSSRGGFMDQSGRSRKYSSQDNRPRNGSYGIERPDAVSYNNNHPRGVMLDDPKIVGDALRGCHHGWIGPDNHNVNELFVSELPDGTQPIQVQEMFVREVGVTPMRAVIKVSFGGRSHAFALFASTGDAKLALRVAEGNPKINGVPVRVSVPRRFYQYPREDEYHHNAKPQVADGQATETRHARGVTRMSSHEEEGATVLTEEQKSKLQYSPQDARSDLQKKASRPSPEANPVFRESPQSQKTNVRQPSPGATKASQTEQSLEGESIKAESVVQDVQQPNLVAAVSNSTEAEQPIASIQSSDSDRLETSQVSYAEQTVEDDALAPTEKLLAGAPTQLRQELGQTTGHVRVESQTKALFEQIEDDSGTSDGATVVVKVPSPEDGETLKVDLGTSQAPETGSDEEAGNDSSFMSAQEVVDNNDATTVHKVEPTSTNTGTEPSNALVAESPVKEGAAASSPTAHPEPQQHSVLPANQDITSPVAVTVDTSAHTTDMSTSVKDIETAVMTPAPPSAAPLKKQGPQQTPSLNPFAKPTKSQRKKERELKKRELKKEQEGKTVKAKTSTALSTPSVLESTVEVNDESRATVETSAVDASASMTKDASKGTTSGKQTGADTANISREIGSVTQKAKMESLDISGLLSHVQSPRSGDVPVPEQTAAQNLDVVAAGSVVKVDTATTATRAKKSVANPNLKLQAPSSSNRLQAIQSDSTASSQVEPPKSTGTAVDQQHPSKSVPEPGAMSAGSSATLLASEGGQPSPSPTTQAFHTPLQTPALPDAAQEQAEKPKKKKKKSKKKKTPATAVEAADHDSSVAGTSVAGGDTNTHSPTGELEDPFGHQMSHIDAIRAGLKNPNTYYSQVNRAMAERDAKLEANRAEEPEVMKVRGS
ncbi:hypothetical protein HBI65_045000 [Parastagonospora nodorum]|nr:hypothetical protein HBH82_199630 [Parastagonospora nodorum]KAH4708609.1 hypothetical protein HBH67_061880 [Parastagonospora nodorum]KAH4713016.1 hypothetical protein HBH78_046940 [Parastagonospora nodorum]KAH4781780.1 hypothetical protein HBH62_119310 [Parastagonospora nodorum]KAH4815508.1 hypothetical protein HBH63_052090 [Parastagonospora nodorum]